MSDRLPRQVLANSARGVPQVETLDGCTRLQEGEAVLEAKFMLGIIALAAQCLAMQEKHVGSMTVEQEQAIEFTYYFMEAIEGKPLATAYNEEIAKYISEWYKIKADPIPPNDGT